MKYVTGLVLAAACLLCSGCLVLATVAAVGALATTTIKTTGKTAGAAVETPARVASAPVASAPVVSAPVASSAVTAPAEPAVAAALTVESAAKLARPGVVVVVDQSNGAVAELPWQEGMTLAAAASAGKSGGYKAATIFRNNRALPADLRQAWTGDLVVFAGDVVELRH
jgi:hypothetical protein